jgi:hypothetical protein
MGGMIYCIYTSTTEVIFREREKRQIEKGRERMKLVEWADALNHLHHFSLSLSHSLSLSLSLSPHDIKHRLQRVPIFFEASYTNLFFYN